MFAKNILNSNVHINCISDESGKRCFNAKILFSDDDVLTIYRGSLDELLDDLAQILISSFQARIIKEEGVI
jgi:hypothetical protein